MKFVLNLVFAGLFLLLQTSTLQASELKKLRAEADQYLLERDFNKAYKAYFKLAKYGDPYSQGHLSNMYVNGEGRKVDLSEAYAWAMVAAENGSKEMAVKSEKLLEQIDEKSRAEKKAKKLISKYSTEAVKKRVAKKKKFELNHKAGGCTGSKLGCS